MITVNRTAIVVKPDQALLDWLHRVDPTSNELSLEDLQREPTVYLLPECENEEEARQYLGRCAVKYSMSNWDGWYRLPATKPNRRDLDDSIAGSSGAFTRWWSISPTFR